MKNDLLTELSLKEKMEITGGMDPVTIAFLFGLAVGAIFGVGLWYSTHPGEN